MGLFLENAQNLFEAAVAAAESGAAPSGLTVLVGREGGIHILSDSDWPLDRVLEHHGATMAYRIEDRNGRTRLEGRDGLRRCVLESEAPAPRGVPRLLDDWRERAFRSERLLLA